MEKTFPEIMTTTEAMEYLRVTRKTLLKLVHKGEIPARKIGKDYRYVKSEIDTYLRGYKESSYFSS
ncbi:helix-turn-helix domain-containing protein [bacterium]|nr:helix-turn-helix domain-containing protein [bacterium]